MFNLSVSETRAKVKFCVTLVRPRPLGCITTYMVPVGNNFVSLNRLWFGLLFFFRAAQEVLHLSDLLLR